MEEGEGGVGGEGGGEEGWGEKGGGYYYNRWFMSGWIGETEKIHFVLVFGPIYQASGLTVYGWHNTIFIF